jgi:ABC-type glycerol-3-phosphate transport system permease component
MKKKEKEFVSSKVHYKTSFGDKLISVITYIIYSIFAFVCVYPFYYIFINSISSNQLSDRGKIIFIPREIHFTNCYRNGSSCIHLGILRIYVHQ